MNIIYYNEVLVSVNYFIFATCLWGAAYLSTCGYATLYSKLRMPVDKLGCYHNFRPITRTGRLLHTAKKKQSTDYPHW